MAAADPRAELQRLGLPRELIVRFVSVRLPTGELEVLVTSLLDAAAYPTEEFLTVYHWRWPHETYYGRLKGRLDLENWSGQSAEAVRQDFHQRAFARAVLADERMDLAGCNLERNIFERAGGAKTLLHLAHAQARCGHLPLELQIPPGE